MNGRKAACCYVGWIMVLLSLLPAVGRGDSPPVPVRIVSFHQGRANPDLIRRAAQLGFNGVQFQLEHGNLQPLLDFRQRDRQEGYISLCHQLGMSVSVWIHELDDIPAGVGGPSLDNAALWALLSERYELILGGILPEIDALVLIMNEAPGGIDTQHPEAMAKLVSVIYEKCRKYKKDLILRTFAIGPERLRRFLEGVALLPPEIIIMSKTVPLDWDMRTIPNPALGAVRPHRQYLEFDLCGEFFQTTRVINCFPELVQRQLAYGLEKGIVGVCGRVDRFDRDILDQPQEVNLWALGMLAAGRARTLDEIWQAYGQHAFGPLAAEMRRILEPTGQVIAEALCVGSFSFGDTRRKIPPTSVALEDTLNSNAFHTAWAAWLWDPNYLAEYQQARQGSPEIIAREEKATREALTLAWQSQAALDALQSLMPVGDYEFFRAKLQVNEVYLQTMSHMQLAYLKRRQWQLSTDAVVRRDLQNQIEEHLSQLRQLHAQAQSWTIHRRSQKETAETILVDIIGWLEQFPAP